MKKHSFVDILGFFDLKSKFLYSYTPLAKQKEMAYELRENSIFSDYGFSAYIRVTKMCRQIQRQPQDKEIYMYGPISLHGICSTYLSGESQRHRGMFACSIKQALSHGHSQQSFPQYLGRSEEHTSELPSHFH